MITSELVDRERAELLAENRELRGRVALLAAIVGALVALRRVSKTRLEFERIPEGGSKRVPASSDREIQEGDAFDRRLANCRDLADSVSQLVQSRRRL